MAGHEEHPARSILDPTGAGQLQRALERLRSEGLSRAEAAAEIVRANLYNFLDGERDAQSGACPRLRIIKR